MNTIRIHVFTAMAGMALLLAGMPSAMARADETASARVHVTYANPQNFSENRQYGSQDRFNNLDYLGPLKAHLIKRAAPMLGAGQQLDITITDIQLAGGYELWLSLEMSHVRIMRDRYPPRIDLQFQWIGSDGKVLREGSRKLKSLGFLYAGGGAPGNSDVLRFDKALLDQWLRHGLQKL